MAISHLRESPVFSSIILATPSGIVVLNDGELGLAKVTLLMNSAIMILQFINI